MDDESKKRRKALDEDYKKANFVSLLSKIDWKRARRLKNTPKLPPEARHERNDCLGWVMAATSHQMRLCGLSSGINAKDGGAALIKRPYPKATNFIECEHGQLKKPGEK